MYYMKSITSVRVEKELLEEAKRYGIVVSKVLEDALREIIEEKRKEELKKRVKKISKILKKMDIKDVVEEIREMREGR